MLQVVSARWRTTVASAVATLLTNVACASSDPAPPVPQSESGPLAGLTDAHNAERSITADGLPPLRWDDELAGVAQSWSDKLARDGCSLEHSSGPYGENLFWASGSVDADDVVDAWVSEKLDYTLSPSGNEELCTGVCGHYTQVVWRDTERLGCGVAACTNGRSGQVWTCNYDPPGNYYGELPY